MVSPGFKVVQDFVHPQYGVNIRFQKESTVGVSCVFGITLVGGLQGHQPLVSDKPPCKPIWRRHLQIDIGQLECPTSSVSAQHE